MPSSQAQRRHDPYPWTWEIPAAAVTVFVLIAAVGIQLGRAIANLIAGAGWHLPAVDDLFTSIPGVLSGDAAAGLTGLASPGSSTAGDAALWVWVIVVDALLLAGAVVAVKRVLDRWGPGRVKGMATRAEAEQLLGLSRLRRNAPVIRPDLYATTRQRLSATTPEPLNGGEEW